MNEGDFEAKPSVLLLGQYSTGRRAGGRVGGARSSDPDPLPQMLGSAAQFVLAGRGPEQEGRGFFPSSSVGRREGAWLTCCMQARLRRLSACSFNPSSALSATEWRGCREEGG